MAVALTVRQRDKPLEMTVFTSPEAVGLSVTEYGGRGPKEYTGEYTVNPTFGDQTLDTYRKLMKNDITVKAIPVTRTSNVFGGKTVVIG